MYNYPNWKNGNGHRLKNFRRSRIVFGNRIGSLFLYASLLALVALDMLVFTGAASVALDLNDSVVNSQSANVKHVEVLRSPLRFLVNWFVLMLGKARLIQTTELYHMLVA